MGVVRMRLLGRYLTVFSLVFLWTGLVWASGGEGGEHHVSFMMEAFRVVNFVVFAFLLYKFAGQPIKNYFKERIHTIELALREAKEAMEEAEERAKEHAAKLKNAEVELKDMLYHAERERDEQIRRIREETEKMAQRIREQAEAAANLEVKKARMELQKEAAELAVSMAEGLIKENFTDEDQMRLLSEYTTKIKGVH